MCFDPGVRGFLAHCVETVANVSHPRVEIAILPIAVFIFMLSALAAHSQQTSEENFYPEPLVSGAVLARRVSALTTTTTTLAGVPS